MSMAYYYHFQVTIWEKSDDFDHTHLNILDCNIIILCQFFAVYYPPPRYDYFFYPVYISYLQLLSTVEMLVSGHLLPFRVK